jgi:hypothetical protein
LLVIYDFSAFYHRKWDLEQWPQHAVGKEIFYTQQCGGHSQ